MPRLYDATAEAIDRRIGWDKLPLLLAMPVLIGLRNVLILAPPLVIEEDALASGLDTIPEALG